MTTYIVTEYDKNLADSTNWTRYEEDWTDWFRFEIFLKYPNPGLNLLSVSKIWISVFFFSSSKWRVLELIKFWSRLNMTPIVIFYNVVVIVDRWQLSLYFVASCKWSCKEVILNKTYICTYVLQKLMGSDTLESNSFFPNRIEVIRSWIV